MQVLDPHGGSGSLWLIFKLVQDPRAGSRPCWTGQPVVEVALWSLGSGGPFEVLLVFDWAPVGGGFDVGADVCHSCGCKVNVCEPRPVRAL